MIHMTTLQSWSTMLLLVLLAAALVWLIHELAQWRANRDRLAAAPATTNVNTPLATVTELRPVKRGAHLTLVQDLPRDASLTPYDWKIQGL